MKNVVVALLTFPAQLLVVVLISISDRDAFMDANKEAFKRLVLQKYDRRFSLLLRIIFSFIIYFLIYFLWLKN